MRVCVCHFNMLCICSSICPSIYGIYNVSLSIYLLAPNEPAFELIFRQRVSLVAAAAVVVVFVVVFVVAAAY